MVKIDNLASFDQITAATGTQAASPEGAMSFSDVLRNAVKEIETPEAVSEIKNVSPAGSTESVVEAGVSEDAILMLGQTSELLEALEDFAAKLASGSYTLKQVDPEVTRIEDMAGELEQSLGSLDELDEELAGLVRQVVTQTKVEVMKFQRGDYI